MRPRGLSRARAEGRLAPDGEHVAKAHILQYLYRRFAGVFPESSMLVVNE